MCLFNKEDVYVGYSLEQLAKVRGVLKNAGIKYSYKIVNHSGWGRGRRGSFGVNMDYARQYTVSVKKKDYEKAKYLVNSVLRN